MRPWSGPASPSASSPGARPPRPFTFVSREDAVPPRLESSPSAGRARGWTTPPWRWTSWPRSRTSRRTSTRSTIRSISTAPRPCWSRRPPSRGCAPRPACSASCWTARCARRATPSSPARRSTPPRTTCCALLPRRRRGGESISLGTLFNRRGVEVKLDPNGLSRHLAIIAQTGAGKSYLAGKILEDLLGLGATIIVLDPNSDYVQLRKLIEDERVPYRQARKTEHAARIDLYRVPGIQNRRYSGTWSARPIPTPSASPTWRPRTCATSPGCPRPPSASARPWATPAPACASATWTSIPPT